MAERDVALSRAVEQAAPSTMRRRRRLPAALAVLIASLCCVNGDIAPLSPLSPEFLPNRNVSILSGSSPASRIINLDTRFAPWSRRFPIPFYIDPAYTMEERELIEDAVRQIEGDLKLCVSFQVSAFLKNR